MGTTKSDIDLQREGGRYTGGDGNYIGDIGGTVDVNGIFGAMIEQNVETAQGITTLQGYADMVNTGQDWDLKNNKSTVFGISWEYAKNNSGKHTTFTFKNHVFEDASDVGNYHAGYMGRYLDGGQGFDRRLLLFGAGVAETIKDFKRFELLNAANQAFQLFTAEPPYGDEPDDFIWNDWGMHDADNSKQ